MTQLRCTLFALLGLTLAACDDGKTVVSVNYSYGSGIADVESVHVLITQGGQKFETTFETPQVAATTPELLPDGGNGTGVVDIMVDDTAFFQRYDLDGFKDGEATLKVELSKGGAVLYTEETTFEVRENGAVAAYAEFEIEPPAPVDTASSADTAASSAAAPTDAGSSDSGAAATSAPAPASSSAGDAATTVSDSGTVEAGSSSDAATGSSDASTDGG